MKRWWVAGVIATVLIPLLALSWLVATQSGLRWAVSQGAPYLPGELALEDVQGSLLGPIVIQGLAYRQDGTVAKAQRIELVWQPLSLLAATIDVNRLHIESLEIALSPSEEPQSAMVLPEIRLPWRVQVTDLQINGASLEQNGQHHDLQQLSLNASSLFSQIDIEALSLVGEGFSLALKGQIRPTKRYPHQLQTEWRVQLPSEQWLMGRGELNGDLDQLKLTQHLRGPLLATVDGEIDDPLGAFIWRAALTAEQLDSSKLHSEWPSYHGRVQLSGKGDLSHANLSGKLQADSSDTGPFSADFKLATEGYDRLSIEQLVVTSPQHDTRINASGSWQAGPDGGALALILDWQNLRWPLDASPWFDSAVGSGWVEGSISHYRFGIATDSPWPQVPPSTWYANASGDREGIDFHSLRITTLQGEVRSSGRLSWAPQLSWQATIQATDLNPQSLWADWPGQLNGQLSSHGYYQDETLRVDNHIQRLGGVLRGYPVSAQGRVDWRKSGLDIRGLHFNSGRSSIELSGRLAEMLNLEWHLSSADLAELYPKATGELQASGQLNGPRLSPQMETSVNGMGLSLAGYQIGIIDGTFATQWNQWQQLKAKVLAQGLVLNNVSLQSLEIQGDDAGLTLITGAESWASRWRLAGKADSQGWRGQLLQADVESNDFQQWQLEAPTALVVKADQLQLAPLCWLNRDSRLCLNLLQEPQGWQASLAAKQLALALFSPWLPADLTLEGVANADIELRYRAEQLTGSAEITLPASAISYPLLEGERDRWEYRGGILSVRVNQQGMQAESSLNLSNGDHFKGVIELPGARLLDWDLSQQALRGEAQLSIHDLGLIEAFIPEIQGLQGEVGVQLSAAGTLDHPRMSVQADMRNGQLKIPRLGLNIEAVQLKAQSASLERLNFELAARSGDGVLSLKGRTLLDRVAGWPTEIEIKGDSFEVSRIPEARVLVSPDIQITTQRRKAEINGVILIPYAKLQPKDITTATHVSEDVVIIGSERSPAEKWAVSTQLRVILGERVHFYGFGFEGRLGGNLLLTDLPGQLTTASGEINVPEGRYRAYGQRLDVEQGRLLYAGGPLSNPGLDLRAVRHVNGVTAGLKVRGSLTKPELELFSIPAMGQTDALAYLMLGRPLENASGEDGALMAKAALALGLSGGDRLARTLGDRFGLDEMRVESDDSGEQASLVIGRYLSPKLYVSYGVGLIEAVNTFNVRYQISSKWQLKGESGLNHSADLLYTIER